MALPARPAAYADPDFVGLEGAAAELETRLAAALAESDRIAARTEALALSNVLVFQRNLIFEANGEIDLRFSDSSSQVAFSTWSLSWLEGVKVRLAELDSFFGTWMHGEMTAEHERVLPAVGSYLSKLERQLSPRFKALRANWLAESELNAADPVLLRRCTYLGGHTSLRGPIRALDLFISVGIHIGKIDEENPPLHWSEVTALVVEGPEQAEQRVTATRVVAGGILGALFKERERRAYLTVQTDTGDYIFEVPGISLYELRAQLAPYMAALASRMPVPPAVPSEAPAADPLDRLAKLGGLRSAGVLTAEEFAEQKAKLLAEL